MDYELKKNHHYVIEWIDPLHIVVGDDPNDIKERTTTYGKYLGENEGVLHLVIETKQEDNVVKIPTKCVMSVKEVEEGGSGFGTVFCVLMFFAVCTSLYYTFNPPESVKQAQKEEILKQLLYEVTIIEE